MTIVWERSTNLRYSFNNVSLKVSTINVNRTTCADNKYSYETINTPLTLNAHESLQVAMATVSEPAAKRRRISSSAAELQSAISHPGSIKINVSGAYIVKHEDPTPPESPDGSNGATPPEEHAYEHDKRDIRLPNHTAVVSHVAADIGGSLAKVVYFSREQGAKEPGGRLHFLKFETNRIDACIEFMRELQCKQREANGSRKSLELCVMATGGGAFKYYDRIRDRLGVDVVREDEMECLIQGDIIPLGRETARH